MKCRWRCWSWSQCTVTSCFSRMCQKTPVPTASPCTWSLWLDSNHRKFCTGKRRGLSLSPSAMLLVSETSWSVRYRCNMSHRYVLILFSEKGAGIAQWLSSALLIKRASPGRSLRRIFFFMVNFLCWLLFWYRFHLRVTAVARTKSQSFCLRCRWQVRGQHTCALYVYGVE